MTAYVDGLRAAYRQAGSGWEGIVKDSAGDVVAGCGHRHARRDQYTYTYGPAARDCAQALLREMRSAVTG